MGNSGCNSRDISYCMGTLVEAMDVRSAQTLLMRGGTSYVGMAASSIVKQLGLIDALRNSNGADYVIVDKGKCLIE